MWRRVALSFALAGAGFCFGLLLLGVGVWTAGGGDGAYLTIGLSSSPLGLTQNIWIAIFGAPFLWCFVGAVLGWVPHRMARALFLAAMMAHYGALPIILGEKSYFGDWMHLPRVPAYVITAALLLYAIGQFGIWVLFVVQHRSTAARIRFGVADLVLTTSFFIGLFFVPGAIVLTSFRSFREKEYDFARLRGEIDELVTGIQAQKTTQPPTRAVLTTTTS